MTIRNAPFHLLAGCVAAVLLAPPVTAAPILDATWYEFSFGDVGSTAIGCAPADPDGNFCISSSGTLTEFAPAPTWDISLADAATFTITDAFESGDRFDLFDFGVLVGSTSVPVDGADCGDDPVPCLANASISSGAFAVAAGNHAFSILTNAAPSEGGVAYFRVDLGSSELPEPPMLALFAAGVAWLWRRRSI